MELLMCTYTRALQRYCVYLWLFYVFLSSGIAVPTSISVNEIFANCSPSDRASSRILKKGDVVKVDLGAHIDGFVAAAAYTVVCCSSNATAFAGDIPAAAATEAIAAAEAQLAAFPAAPDEYKQQQQEARGEETEALTSIEGPSALVLKAAWTATEAALRKMEIGGKASEVTKIIEQVAEEFGVRPMHVTKHKNHPLVSIDRSVSVSLFRDCFPCSSKPYFVRTDRSGVLCPSRICR